MRFRNDLFTSWAHHLFIAKYAAAYSGGLFEPEISCRVCLWLRDVYTVQYNYRTAAVQWYDGSFTLVLTSCQCELLRYVMQKAAEGFMIMRQQAVYYSVFARFSDLRKYFSKVESKV